MAELSPAAQAVVQAFNARLNWLEDGVLGPPYRAIAAALLAAADDTHAIAAELEDAA